MPFNECEQSVGLFTISSSSVLPVAVVIKS